ncbi:MAG: hypothetical protein KAR40_16260 [Candidatus Sabulitectum sp.]|nr:hypothetical protein [Candidatus Sabulitectum sp.]
MRISTRLANQLKDDVILDALLEVAREHLDIYLHSGEGDLSLWSDSHAVIQFDSSRAIEFIEVIANQEYSDKNEQLKSTILFAREFLEETGNRKWTKFLVEHELDVLIGFKFVELSCVSKFRGYPKDVVRGVILDRITQGAEGIGVYIYLLTHYCEDADIGLIRSNLCQVHPDIVDVITQRLPVLRSHSNQTLINR